MKRSLLEHTTIIAMAMINIPIIYNWLSSDGYHSIFAAVASVALDMGILYVATERQQSIYSRIGLVSMALLLISIQVYLFGYVIGALHSGYTIAAMLILVHIQWKQYSSNVGMVAHIEQYEQQAKQGYVCEQCGKVYKTPSALKAHMTRVHSNSDAPMQQDIITTTTTKRNIGYDTQALCGKGAEGAEGALCGKGAESNTTSDLDKALYHYIETEGAYTIKEVAALYGVNYNSLKAKVRRVSKGAE